MAQKPTILGLNWKMHPQSREEASRILEGMSETLARMRQTQIMLFPPSILFDYVRTLEAEYGLYCSMGVQDVGRTAEGSHTGQISAPMVFDSGAECALIGHSETRRRQALAESEVNEKFEQAVTFKLSPVLCVGYQESTETKEVDYDAIRTQLRTVLEDRRTYIREYGVTIAYEPTWAIGTGTPADAETIETVCLFIRKQIAEIAGQDMRDVVNVL
ncbi:MAG: triose-phosphate isomerase, partial [Candidatus Paceibacteria bacterium]